MVLIGLIQSIHQVVFSEISSKQVNICSYKNVSRGSFNPSPRSDKCIDKHIYLSILRIFKQRPYWSVLVNVVLLRLGLYLVWWTDSNADQVSYPDLILI